MKFLLAAVAVSANGIEDLEGFFQSFPTKPNMAFIIVAPLPRHTNSNLAGIISNYTRLPVIKATQSTLIKPNHIYVIAENTILTVDQYRLIVSQRNDKEIVNNTIDTLLSSLGTHWKRWAAAVFLGGLGKSGVEGAKVIGSNGGYVITRTTDGTKSTEMAQNVIIKDSPDVTLPLEKIPAHLLAISGKKELNYGRYDGV